MAKGSVTTNLIGRKATWNREFPYAFWPIRDRVNQKQYVDLADTDFEVTEAEIVAVYPEKDGLTVALVAPDGRTCEALLKHVRVLP